MSDKKSSNDVLIGNSSFNACKICGTPRVIEYLSDGSQRILECQLCKAKKPCLKPPIVIDESLVNEFNMDNINNSITNDSTVKSKICVKNVTLVSILNDLKRLKMPINMKQYKLINKAIKAIEQAIVEEETSNANKFRLDE